MKNDRNTTFLQQVYNSPLTWGGPHALWSPPHVRGLLYTCCKSVVRESVLFKNRRTPISAASARYSLVKGERIVRSVLTARLRGASWELVPLLNMSVSGWCLSVASDVGHWKSSSFSFLAPLPSSLSLSITLPPVSLIVHTKVLVQCPLRYFILLTDFCVGCNNLIYGWLIRIGDGFQSCWNVGIKLYKLIIIYLFKWVRHCIIIY